MASVVEVSMTIGVIAVVAGTAMILPRPKPEPPKTEEMKKIERVEKAMPKPVVISAQPQDPKVVQQQQIKDIKKDLEEIEKLTSDLKAEAAKKGE